MLHRVHSLYMYVRSTEYPSHAVVVLEKEASYASVGQSASGTKSPAAHSSAVHEAVVVGVALMSRLAKSILHGGRSDQIARRSPVTSSWCCLEPIWPCPTQTQTQTQQGRQMLLLLTHSPLASRCSQRPVRQCHTPTRQWQSIAGSRCRGRSWQGPPWQAPRRRGSRRGRSDPRVPR